MVVLRGCLEPEVGALLLQALSAARETLYQQARRQEAPSETSGSSENLPTTDPPTTAQQRADALSLLAETALHHGLDPGAPGERYQVVVHVDAQVLADPDQPGQSVLQDGARVSAETSQRLACDASRVVMRHDEAGRLVEIGARTRTIPPALRRALEHRDRGCRFPGCGLPFGQGITCATGPRAAPPRSPTSPCSAAGTTARSTRRAIMSIASPTAHSSSGGRTGGSCPTFRRQPPCQSIGPGAPCPARGAGAPPPRADGVPALAGGAPGSGLGDRRPAPPGHASRATASATRRIGIVSPQPLGSRPGSRAELAH
jgi:hypothetical protein